MRIICVGGMGSAARRWRTASASTAFADTRSSAPGVAQQRMTASALTAAAASVVRGRILASTSADKTACVGRVQRQANSNLSSDTKLDSESAPISRHAECGITTWVSAAAGTEPSGRAILQSTWGRGRDSGRGAPPGRPLQTLVGQQTPTRLVYIWWLREARENGRPRPRSLARTLAMCGRPGQFEQKRTPNLPLASGLPRGPAPLRRQLRSGGEVPSSRRSPRRSRTEES